MNTDVIVTVGALILLLGLVLPWILCAWVNLEYYRIRRDLEAARLINQNLDNHGRIQK